MLENVPLLQTAFYRFANMRFYGAFSVCDNGILPPHTFKQYNKTLINQGFPGAVIW